MSSVDGPTMVTGYPLRSQRITTVTDTLQRSSARVCRVNWGNPMNRLLSRLVRNERGATMVEYGLVLVALLLTSVEAASRLH
jgi:hypothetical protein